MNFIFFKPGRCVRDMTPLLLRKYVEHDACSQGIRSPLIK
jgi:hypothetical protein